MRIRSFSALAPVSLVLVTVLAAGSLVVLGAQEAEACAAVHRFYNVEAGTHFYTASEEEANRVRTSYAGAYAYEGIAYLANEVTNPDPLYRFYNKSNGSHFYTASAEERDAVQARWSSVYAYEGVAYHVAP